MYINLDVILSQRGLTRYRLSEKIGCNYQNLVKLCNNKTRSINFKLLEDICKCLKCTPNDVMVMKDGKE